MSFSYINAQSEKRVFERHMMGTVFRIIIQGDSTSLLAVEKAYEEIKRINAIFSTYDPNSEVSKLNASRKWMEGSPELLKLVNFSEHLNQRSEGAFDIKIGSSIRKWKIAFQNKSKPGSSKIDLRKKKQQRISIKGSRIRTNKHTILDFGAIAKGFAVDQAFKTLKQLGFDTILVDGGGDIRVGAKPADSEGWKIAQHFENGRILELSNCAIATSGQDYQYLKTNNGTVSHILDPDTLEGLQQEISVSIISDTCMKADALATAVSVLGASENLQKHYSFKAKIKKSDHWIVKQF